MATELGKAYVQIIPSARGISGELSNALSGEATAAGTSAGLNIANAIKSVIAAAGIGTALKSVIDAGMTFDKSMSQVAATMGTTTNQIQNLRDFAQEMGATTAFSATEAADALNYMALAGYDAETSMAMLPNVLNLAAAGGIDLAYASDMVTDASSALGLSIDETAVMVDQMAKASSKSNTSVSQLGEAILTIGATARSVKGGTTELSTVLGVLADNGIKGAEGGTHLRNILLSLQTPTKAGTAALKQLGMTYDDMYDSAGNMRAIPEIMLQLQSSMEGMTQASKDAIISGIFNKTDLASVKALIGTSRERFDELTAAIEDSAGAAEQMANTQLDNLAGDITLFESALEGAKIALSDGLSPALRGFVQEGTTLLESFVGTLKADGLVSAINQLTTGIIEAAKNSYINAMTQAAANAPEIISAGTQIVFGLVSGLLAALPSIVTAAINLALSFADAIMSYDWMAVAKILLMTLQISMSSIASTIFGTDTSVIDGIIQGIMVGIPQLLQLGVDIISNVIQGITTYLPMLLTLGTDILKSLVQGIQTMLPMLFPIASQLLTTLITGITTVLPMILTSGVTIVQTLLNGILTMLPMIMQQGAQLLMQLIQGIVSIIPQLINATVQLITTIITTVTEHLPEILQTGIDILLELIKGILDTFPDLIQCIFEAILTIVQTVIENLPKIFESGTNILLELIKGIVDIIPKLLQCISEIIDKIRSTFWEFDWPSIGRNLIEGIKNGILGAAQAVVDAVVGVCKSAFNAALSFLGISSPAKKGIYIGEMFGEGVAKGLNQTTSLTEDAAAVMAAKTVNAMNAGMSANLHYAPSGSDASARLDAVVDLLSAYLPKCVEKDPIDGRSFMQSLNRELGLAAL